jgi:hypothetical protein
MSLFQFNPNFILGVVKYKILYTGNLLLFSCFYI